MSRQKNLLDIPNAISLQALEAGRMHSDLPGGRMTSPCGPEVALASRFLLPVGGRVQKTIDTSGPHGFA